MTGSLQADPADPHDFPAQRGPDLLIHRSGFATVRAGRAIFGPDVLGHAHHQVARGLPAGGDPQSATPAVAAALTLAAASAGAREIMISAEPGPDRFTARHVAARDQAILSIAEAIDCLDRATTRLAALPGPMKRRFLPLHVALPHIQHTLRFAAFLSMARASDSEAARLATTTFPQSTPEAAPATALTQPDPGEAARPSPTDAASPPGPRTAP